MLIISIVLFLLFLVYTFFLISKKLEKIDETFYQKLTIKEPFITILKFITDLASFKFYIFSGFCALIFFENKKVVISIIVGLLINALLVKIIKEIMKRDRPTINQLVKEKGYSYISGHTCSATFGYGFLAFLITLSNLSVILKILIILLIILFIFIIAYSRIYLGVHYLSDTIGAFLLGTSNLLIYIYFISAITNIFEN